MKISRIHAGEFGSNCWLVIDESTSDAVIIDPSPSIDIINDFVSDRGVFVKFILLTHGHFDHMTSADTLRDITNAPLCIHEDDARCLTNSNFNVSRAFMAEDMVFRPADILLRDGDTLNFGSLEVKVMHTPGHSMGSVCFFIGDALFTGDTVFDCSIGRTDLAGGDMRSLISSLKKISEIKNDYTVYPGHGSVTTLEKQKKFNVYLKGI